MEVFYVQTINRSALEIKRIFYGPFSGHLWTYDESTDASRKSLTATRSKRVPRESSREITWRSSLQSELCECKPQGNFKEKIHVRKSFSLNQAYTWAPRGVVGNVMTRSFLEVFWGKNTFQKTSVGKIPYWKVQIWHVLFRHSRGLLLAGEIWRIFFREVFHVSKTFKSFSTCRGP